MIKLLLFAGLIFINLLYWFNQPAPQAFKPKISFSTMEYVELDAVTKRIDGELTLASHAVTAVEVGRGLRAFWFAGTREGHRDVTINSAYFDYANQSWSQPRPLFGREQVQDSLGQYVKKLGNPVAIMRDDKLWLFFVSVSVGGWATSQVNYTISTDGGLTFGPVQQLELSPLLNLSYLVRTRAHLDANNNIWLPVYFEMGNHIPEFLVINDKGQVIDRQRIDALNGSMQAEMLPHIDGGFDVYARPNSPRHIPAWVNDEFVELNIDNSNSAVSVVQSHGLKLLASNPKDAKRTQLWLYFEQNGNWHKLMPIAHGGDVESGDQFSYPWLQFDKYGHLHIFYSAHKREIIHQVIPRQELNEAVNTRRIELNQAEAATGEQYVYH